MKYVNILTLFCLLISCSEQENNTPLFKVNSIPSPSIEGGEPHLFTSNNGSVYLSWVEYLNDTTDALVFSKLNKNQWCTPQTIAQGSNWFVNWADFPSLVIYDDGTSMAAHWLQMSGEGTYDYDVRISQSIDEGKTWSASFIPHRDSVQAEHGFVSMIPVSADKMFAIWLDGRYTKVEENSEGAHQHKGAMTLRGAIFNKKGKILEETELDDRVCDCCQTSAALTEDGIIVAYRDRSQDEIRDIGIVRQVNGKWTSPSIAYGDNWFIAGCPVNGPSIKANGKKVVLSWFSMNEDKGEVKVAFSNNSGASFQEPIRVDEGNPLGRVDVLFLSDEVALVSWLEQVEEKAEIRAAKVTLNGDILSRHLITKTDPSRSSGFPVMTKVNEQVLFAWTAVDSLTRVETALVGFD